VIQVRRVPFRLCIVGCVVNTGLAGAQVYCPDYKASLGQHTQASALRVYTNFKDGKMEECTLGEYSNGSNVDPVDGGPPYKRIGPPTGTNSNPHFWECKGVLFNMSGHSPGEPYSAYDKNYRLVKPQSSKVEFRNTDNHFPGGCTNTQVTYWKVQFPGDSPFDFIGEVTTTYRYPTAPQF